MSKILQLDPPLALTTPKGRGVCHFLADQGVELNPLWGVIDEKTGEIWWWPNDEVRGQSNVSVGRKIK